MIESLKQVGHWRGMQAAPAAAQSPSGLSFPGEGEIKIITTSVEALF